MERVKRRWWTLAVSLFAALIVLAAAISGAFQLAVLTLPSYRADLSAWITRVANRPVQIGGINLNWRGLEPRLDLDDITLYSDSGEESLSVEHLSLGFSVWRLVTGNMFPDRLELSGLQLTIESDEQGRWYVAGFGGGDDPQWREVLARDLARFRHLRLQNCELLLSTPMLGSQPQSLQLTTLEIDQTLSGFELSGALRLPAAYGDLAELAADVSGPIEQPAQWHGDFEVNLKRLRPQGWLQQWLPPGMQLAAQNLGLTIEGSFAQQQLQQADLRLESGALLMARKGHSQAAKRARLRASVRADGDAWRVDLDDMRLDDERLSHGSLRWRHAAAQTELDVDAGELRLTRLTPWLAIWSDDQDSWQAQAARLSGNLRNLVLRLRQGDAEAWRYSAAARLEDIALAANDKTGAPGFARLSGELSANEAGGRFQFDRQALQLVLPELFAQPVQFDSLSSIVQWQRSSEGWRVTVPQLAWSVAGSTGDGRLQLDIPSDDPHEATIDLSARFVAQDLDSIKAYMPLHWPEHLRDWLRSGLRKGRVSHGDLLIRGPLADFPFHQRMTGQWKLDLDTVGVSLAYAPDWPTLDDVAAHLSFSGNALTVETQSARLNGNPILRASARFDDFNDGLLRVNAVTSGEIANYYDFLRDSPLHQRLSGLLDMTTASGPAEVAMQLVLPLHDLKSTQVQGSVALTDVQLLVGKLAQPLSAINGRVQFDEHGVSADSLTARFEELPLAVRIVPRAGTHGVVQADFNLRPNADGSGTSALIPALVRSALHGESAWHAELPIQDHDTALQLSSDLRGTEVLLPEPLAKPADALTTISVRIGGDAAAPLRIGFAYAQKLGGDLALSTGAQGTRLDGMHLRFGGDVPTPAVKNSYFVDGHVDTLDLGGWLEIAGASSAASATGTGGGEMRLDSIEIDADHLRWQHQLSAATHLRYQPQANGWHAELSGEGAQGSVDWQGPAPGRLSARLERVRVKPQAPPGEVDAAADKAASDSKPPIDPARWPELDINVASLHSGDSDLGALTLLSARVPGGQKIDKLTVAGGLVDLEASGQWRRIDARSSADLHFDLHSHDIENVLKALDYAPNLAAKHSHFTGDLQWQPAASGLSWQAAQGHVELKAEDGQLRAIKPGAGRVLGLINLYALPRRLTLNFSDVVDQGLGFDSVSGKFDLGNGAAMTKDLSIQGPSLRMEMRGRIGLAARDYDEYVTVYPGLSSGLTLGAALVGGPAVGALVLLAQEVLDKPLDQVTQLTYRVSGSWDNPKVERVEARIKHSEVKRR